MLPKFQVIQNSVVQNSLAPELKRYTDENMHLITHIKSSVTIIKTHTIVLLITAIVSGAITFNSLWVHFKHSSWINIPVIVVTFSTTLVMYGLYYEIVEDKYTSMGEIFSKYLYGYFIVSILTTLPVTLFSLLLLLTTPGSSYQSIQVIISVLVSIVFMYVIPYYFHTQKILKSFKCGIGFLVENFQKSLPLITAVVFFYAFKFLMGSTLVMLVSVNTYLYALAQYIFVFLHFIFNYTLFIVLILTITDKNIKV